MRSRGLGGPGLRVAQRQSPLSGVRLPSTGRAAGGRASDFRQRLAREMKRGKVDCSICFRRVQGAELALEVDAAALERLLGDVCTIFPALLPGNHAVNVLDVLRWPGVMRDETDDGEELLKVTARAVWNHAQGAGRRTRPERAAVTRAPRAAVATVGGTRRCRAHPASRSARADSGQLDERLAELQGEHRPDRLEQELALLSAATGRRRRARPPHRSHRGNPPE